jgi:Neuraminidase-like domain/Putative peptidoglycan binding domain
MPIPAAPLHRNDRGSAVAQLHRTLEALNWPIDPQERDARLFGEATEVVLRTLQESSGIPVTGVFDTDTHAVVSLMIADVAPFTVYGAVTDADNRAIAAATVIAVDVDLRHTEELGQISTDSGGEYEVRYSASRFTRAEKQSADVVVRAFLDEEQIAESPVAFNAPAELQVDLQTTERYGPSEFDRLEAELEELRDGARSSELTEVDVEFLSGESGIERQRIDWLAKASRLGAVPEWKGITAAAFYGWFRLGLPVEPERLWATPSAELVAVLVTALDQHIVPSTLRRRLDSLIERIEQIKQDRLVEAPAAGTDVKLGNLLDTMPAPLSPEQLGVVAGAVVGLRPDDRQLADKIARLPGFDGDAQAVARTVWIAALTQGHLPLVRELQDVSSIAPPETATFDLRPFARLEASDWREVLQRQQPGGEAIGAPPGTPGNDDDERLDNYAASLARYVADALPTAVVASRLASDDDVNSPFQSTKSDLMSFFSNNPSFEIGVAPLALYLEEGRDEKLANVADHAALEARLDDLSRVFKLTRHYPEIRALLADGLHSAFAMVQLGKREFAEKFAGPLGGQARAEEVFGNAERVHAGALNIYMRYGAGFNSPTPYVISGGSPGEIARRRDAAGEEPERFVAINATWTGLFGSLDLCECAHCTSLYSPAAYFVDILRFLDESKGAPRPLEVLLARRPDLEHIELSCQNSTTPLPYVDLANELLEAAIVPRTFTFNYGPGLDALLALDGGRLPVRFPAWFAASGYSLAWDASVRADGDSWMILDAGWAFSLEYQHVPQVFAVSAWPQTSWSAGELGANPEHVHDPAYEVLREAVYPWNLPFDLPVEEARTYLRHLGVPRHEVMEIFIPATPEDALSDEALAREYLGLTAEDAGIITGAITHDAHPVVGGATDRPWDFWGLAESGNDLVDTTDAAAHRVTGRWNEALRHVPVLLHQSGLTYRELLELLGTYFINPIAAGERTLRLVAISEDENGKPVDPATCQLNKLRIDRLDDDVIAALARIHRFVRLWRKLDWTPRELDQAITAFDPASLADGFDGFLLRLSHVQRLRAAFDLPVVKLLSWWSDIDIADYIDHLAKGEPRATSLYQQLFRNKTVINPLDDAFTEDAGALTGRISDHLPALVAALGIGAADLSRLTTGPAAVIADDTLSLRNLSLLYRAVSLAKALKLSIREYQTLATVAGLDPFAATPPFAATAATLQFVEMVGAVRDSGFSIEELAYLLRHDLQPSSDLDPAETALATTLEELRDGLQQIAVDTEAPTTDPHGDLTRTKLALLNWDGALVDALVAALNGSAAYEVKTDAFANALDLPNDNGSYAVPLASRPAGVAFPPELDSVIAIDPAFVFACDAEIPIQTPDGGVVSAELRETFADNHINVAAATVTTEVPGRSWTIDRRYAVIRNGGVLGVYDQGELTLRASRLLVGTERGLLAGLTADADFVGALDHLFALQDELLGRIAYEEITVDGHLEGRLRFTGAMTTARKTRLDTVSADPAYRAAIQALYEAPRDLIARVARTFIVHDFAAELDALPAVAFPASLKAKIYFNATSNPAQLHFIGVMTVEQRDVLLALSADPPYRLAINRLFDQAQPGSPRELAPEADDVFLTSADAAALFNDSSDPEARFLQVSKKLLPYLRTTLTERMLTQSLASTLQLETRTTRDLLTRWIAAPAHPQQRLIAEFRAPALTESNPNTPLTAAAFRDQFAALALLHKVALVIKKLRPTPRQLDWLLGQASGGGWLDLSSLPVAPMPAAASSAASFVGWKRLCDLFRILAALPFKEMRLFDLFDVARAASAATTDAARNAAKTAYLADLSQHTLWSVEDLEMLLGAGADYHAQGPLEVTFPDSYADERIIGQLRECFKRMKRLGASAAEVTSWANTTQSASLERVAAASIKSAAKAKHSDEQWPAVAKPLKAPLREKQRSALVSYLVAHPDAKRGQSWTDADELYEHLLADVQMDACMTTTRLLQATNSVQLFVQRCLMNLEDGISLTPDDVRAWSTWRKQYRIWEANRKVLFYPENWIEPELRDDKSPFFEELESELSENDLTMETAEDAFLHYLEKVDQVARLEIVGMCRQQEPGDVAHHQNPIDVLHVFGRTAAIPHQHFYRRLSGGVWSAWERVDLDIDGDHLLPVIWNRRLHLFWAVLTEKQDQPTKEQRAAGDDPRKYWEIKLAWSEYRNKGWSPRRLSAESESLRQDQHLFLSAPGSVLNVLQETRDLSFRSRVSDGQLVIGCYGGLIVYYPVETTVETPAEPFKTVTQLLWTLVSHRTFWGDRIGTSFTCRFTVNGVAPTQDQRDRIQIRFRDPHDPAPIPLNTNGAARSSHPFTTDGVFVDLISAGFRVASSKEAGSWGDYDPGAYANEIVETFKDAVDDAVTDDLLADAKAEVLIGTAVAIVASAVLTGGASIAAALAAIPAAAASVISGAVIAALGRRWGRRVLVDLAPLPTPQSTKKTVSSTQPSLEPMWGIGEFTLEDANDTFHARALPSTDMIPSRLNPLPGARIKT